MNRRIPNGMYGGVGGRELAAPSYPIFMKTSTSDARKVPIDDQRCLRLIT